MTDRPVNRFIHVTFKTPYPRVIYAGRSTSIVAATCEATLKVTDFTGAWPLRTRTLVFEDGDRGEEGVLHTRTLIMVPGDHVASVMECEDPEAEIPALSPAEYRTRGKRG